MTKSLTHHKTVVNLQIDKFNDGYYQVNYTQITRLNRHSDAKHF